MKRRIIICLSLISVGCLVLGIYIYVWSCFDEVIIKYKDKGINNMGHYLSFVNYESNEQLTLKVEQKKADLVDSYREYTAKRAESDDVIYYKVLNNTVINSTIRKFKLVDTVTLEGSIHAKEYSSIIDSSGNIDNGYIIKYTIKDLSFEQRVSEDNASKFSVGDDVDIIVDTYTSDKYGTIVAYELAKLL